MQSGSLAEEQGYSLGQERFGSSDVPEFESKDELIENTSRK